MECFGLPNFDELVGGSSSRTADTFFFLLAISIAIFLMAKDNIRFCCDYYYYIDRPDIILGGPYNNSDPVCFSPPCPQSPWQLLIFFFLDNDFWSPWRCWFAPPNVAPVIIFMAFLAASFYLFIILFPRNNCHRCEQQLRAYTKKKGGISISISMFKGERRMTFQVINETAFAFRPFPRVLKGAIIIGSPISRTHVKCLTRSLAAME